MLKKNQLLLILLTLVLMLSVYFIRNPFNNKKNDVPTDLETSGRIEQLQNLRNTLNDERANQVISLDAIIASSDKSVDEKSKALEEKKYINSLTEKELLLEVQIMNKGYRDCFVHATNTGIDITVVSESNSLTLANEIILMALTGFDETVSDVQVTFQTLTEVMGNVTTENKE